MSGLYEMDTINFSSGVFFKERRGEEREARGKEGSRERVGKSKRSQRSTGRESTRDGQKY